MRPKTTRNISSSIHTSDDKESHTQPSLLGEPEKRSQQQQRQRTHTNVDKVSHTQQSTTGEPEKHTQQQQQQQRTHTNDDSVSHTQQSAASEPEKHSQQSTHEQVKRKTNEVSIRARPMKRYERDGYTIIRMNISNTHGFSNMSEIHSSIDTALKAYEREQNKQAPISDFKIITDKCFYDPMTLKLSECVVFVSSKREFKFKFTGLQYFLNNYFLLSEARSEMGAEI